jgi:F-type H+-transporting ATPase subunit b
VLICGWLFGSVFATSPAIAADAPAAKKADDKEHINKAAHGPELHAAPAGDPEHGKSAEGGHGDHEKAPGGPIDWKTDLNLWTFVVFGIFLVVLRVFAWGPLTSALDAREAKIHGNLAHAEQAREKAERLLADYQTQLAAAQDQILKMMAESRRDAELTRQEILAQTEKDVSLLKDRAVAEIERTRDGALNELFSHMAGTVTSATEKVLGRALTDSDQDRLVNEALVEFSRQQAS